MTNKARTLAPHEIPDVIFESDNAWGVPVLEDALQVAALPDQVRKWGDNRSARMPGLYHFYTDDYKFGALWANPAPVVNSGCMGIVEPNFSTHPQMPRAVVLWRIYQKRWLARYWQTHGLRVMVDLNVEPQFFHLALLGVPAGWQSYASRGYTKHLTALDQQYALACARRGAADVAFFVFGGGASVRGWCEEHGSTWLPEEIDQAKEQ
jgi:hypothetical protein